MENVSRPSARELAQNSRARSALLHVLTKKKGVLFTDLEAECYPNLCLRGSGKRKKVRCRPNCNTLKPQLQILTMGLTHLAISRLQTVRSSYHLRHVDAML